MLINKVAKMSRSSRNTMSASLVVVAAIAMYNWIVAPHTSYLLAAQRHGEVISEIAERNEAVRAALELKRGELRALQDKSELLASMLFTKDKARQFFSDLQVISEQSGCSVDSVNFIKGQRGDKSERLEDITGAAATSAVLSVVGAYGDVVKLLERLVARTEKVWIDSVKMQVLDYRSVVPQCDITITIYTIQDKESTL